MTRRLRRLLRWGLIRLGRNRRVYHSRQHVREFGRSVGRVVEINEHGDARVEWGKTGLRYTYLPEYLETAR